MNDWVVNGYSKRWLKRGFPWVYPKERLKGRGRVGHEVLLRAEDGEVLGRGLADEGKIVARVYRHDGGPLDYAWMRRCLEDALTHRQVLIGEDTNGYRWVHGENDGLPGIRVDWWSHFAVISVETPAVAPLMPLLVQGLVELADPRGIYVCLRYGDRGASRGEISSVQTGLVHGSAPPGPVRVQERGMCMDVDVADGPDVGLYTDMRDLRAWLEPYWGGARVLNTFAYTGAFSVAAARCGASEVVTVDLAAPAVARAEQNFRANDLDPEGHTFLVTDVWKALDRFRRKGERFDRVILDPPSFARGGDGGFQTQRDYPRLIAAACRVLRHGGWLVAASNHGATSPHQFRGMCLEGIHKAKCRGQLLYMGTQAGDVPAATWFPEGSYLKTAVYRVLTPTP